MPPPRLPRHLRPCHPLGTAIQVRCAHKTARTALSTDGDEPPQSTTGQSSDGSTNASYSSTDSNTEASTERRSWWSVALGKVTSLTSEPASTEPHPPAPDIPSTPAPNSIKNKQDSPVETVPASTKPHPPALGTPSTPAPEAIKDEQDIPVGSVSGIKQALVRRLVVSDEKSPPQSQRSKAHSRKGKKDDKVETDGQDVSNSPIRKVRSISHTHSITPMPPMSPMSPSRDLHGQQCHIAEQEGGKEETSARHNPEPAPDSLREEVTSIQRELQRLSGVVKALQVALEAKLTAETPSTSATGRDIRSTESSEPSEKERLPEPVSSSPTAVQVAPSAKDLPAPREPQEAVIMEQRQDIQQIYEASFRTHKRWMSILGTTAEYLVDMPPKAVVSLVSFVLRSIIALERNTVRDEGTGRMAVFGHPHRRATRTLATKLIPRNIPDALLVGETTYRNTTTELTDTANLLDEMQAPLVASIATHVHNRLRVIAENAVLEDDIRVCNVMENYRDLNVLYAEARHSPTLSQQPGLILRLEKLLAKRKVQEFHRSLGFLKKDVTRIETARKTRQAKHTEVRTVDKKVSKTVPDRGGLRIVKLDNESREGPDDSIKNAESTDRGAVQKKDYGSGLEGQIHKRSRSLQPSDNLKTKPQDGGNAPNVSSKPAGSSDELSEQSLLEELFPEANSTAEPQYKEERDHPRIEPPTNPILRPSFVGRTQTLREKVVESFQKQGEQITALQLTNCSTQLTEADFRRVVPKGKHIEGWRRDGDFLKVIPGRDPLSLERLPFYYLLFKNAEAAVAYQKNISRLHKLSALHQPANIFSAIPPPTGFLEKGEDISAAISSYNLLPTHHPLSLNVLMQPYNPHLRALIERGGYQPIAPSVDENGKPIWRVLMHIEGYEPRPSDLFKILVHDAYMHGMILPLRNESRSSIHRVRDMINLRMSSKPISSSRPRAYGTFEPTDSQLDKPTQEMTFDDPAIQKMMEGAGEDGNPQQVNQLIMNRVYNRWILDFEDEDTARRWSAIWHRKVLPDLSDKKGAWKETEEERICNTEVLW
ncbi:hypothetical protein PtrCC142_004714 [Pyrenophora tritici-repentis]|nr:hypothetical protein PtrSN001C_004723 [Pyrenophora tritici-repentis]KAI1571236.1 hypothetical protein PtrEW4_004901 [Pyrenophora tritici-repentis]KAI1603111.1 hypothetical protein PtrCC142_004714 [Pyrenophora tritici-repentis]